MACTMIEEADAATGEKMASICQWCGGWGTSAMRSPEFPARHLFAARFSISASHHPAACVLPIRRLALAKPERPSSRNHALRHSRRRTTERSCLMRDTREMKASMGTSASLFEQETGWS